MNVYRATKDKGLKYDIVYYVHEHDENEHVQRQIIWIQAWNQRSYILCDQRVTNANHQSNGRSQKRNRVKKSGNHTNGHCDPPGNTKKDQAECKAQADQKTFHQSAAQIPADGVIE